MEKHTSKKLIAGILALSAGFVLASCDPITSVPSNYESAIVLNEDGSKVDLKDNLMGKIYDAIATDRNTKIVSDILDEVATNKFGTYAEIMEAKNDASKKATYIENHADVFKRDGDTDEIVEKRFAAFIEDLRLRISEFFYNEITSGSYNDDEGRFDEGKLWMAHYYDLYDISGKELAEANKFFVTAEITKEKVFQWDAAESKLKGTYSAANEGDRGYIEEKIFPQILKDKLVEEYVYNNNYSSLGRAYARKVNYIKISYESDIIPWKLAKAFGDTIVKAESEQNEAIDFEIISKAMKGFEKVDEEGSVVALTDTDSIALLAAAMPSGEIVTVPTGGYTLNETVGAQVIIPEGNYYKETKIGELITSYQKALRAVEAGRFPAQGDKDELDKFLASGKTMQYGLREKVIDLGKEDYTTDGWFLKNGGLSELPSALRDRLFNINVANAIDDPSAIRYECLPEGSTPIEEGGITKYAYGAYEYEADGTTKVKRPPYLRNMNGSMMVIPAKSQSYLDDKYNYIYQDVSGKALYMVQVLEAPSTPKLNKEQSTSYAKIDTENPYRTEDIAKQIAKILGTKDSYIKDAYTECLEKYTFEFYETSLYEHFAAEYPDLFDDED